MVRLSIITLYRMANELKQLRLHPSLRRLGPFLPRDAYA